jgi:hypothetical protein
VNLVTLKALLAAILMAAAVGLVQEVRIRGLQAENARLHGRVNQQSAATELAASQGETEKAESSARALEVKAGAAELKAMLPKGHGPEAMNAWYSELFP